MTTTGVVVSVTPTHRGDTLTIDTTAADTVLWVDDAGDFAEEDDFDTGEHYLVVGDSAPLRYIDTDMDIGAITLAAPVGGDYESGLPVTMWDPTVAPSGAPVVEYVAYVRLSDDSGTPSAVVPHELIPYNGADNLVGATVEIDETAPRVWGVAEVIGREPVFDGSSIDPDSLPPPAITDGLPPDTSPVPTVLGGVGVLHVRWGGVTNADAVTYEVHVSTVDGFTPDATTLAAETPGTAITLRSLPDGTPLAYDTTYYVRIIAKDDDPGTAPVSEQGSGSLYQVSNDEVSAAYAYLGEVSASQIVTGVLDAEVTVSGIVQTSATGRRAVMDAEGIHLYDSADNSLVDLPTDATKAAQFKGTAELQSATVKDGLSLQKPAEAGKPAATVQPGGTLELANGVQPPGSAPAVSVFLPAYQYDGLTTVGKGATWHFNDVHADAAHLWAATADSEKTLRVQRVDRATLAVDRVAAPAFTSTQLPSSTDQATLVGVTQLGTTFYLCLLTTSSASGGTYRIIGYTDDTFATQTGPTWTVSAGAEQVVGIHADGTSIYVASLVCARDVEYGRLRLRQLTAATMAVAAGPWDDNSGQLFVNNALGFIGAIRGGLYYGTAGGQWATPRVVVHGYTDSWARVYTIGAADLVRQSGDEWPLGRNGPSTWDGTRFLQSAGAATKTDKSADFVVYSNLTWTVESAVWWASYAWLNTAQVKRTPQSPRTSFTMTKRRFVTTTSEDVPLTGAADDPDSARHYLGRGAADPGVAGMFTTADGTSVDVPDTFTFTGENPVTTTGFASGAASDLRSGALRRDGTPLAKVASDGKANVDGLIPPGTINMWAGDAAPAGWALCDGAAMNTATTPDLFNAIGFKFGGSGTTYYLPDLRGRFPFGASPAVSKGSVGDSELGSQGTAPGAGDTGRLTHRHTHTIPGQAAGAVWSVASGSLGDAPRAAAYSNHNHGGTTGQAGVGPSLTSNLEYHGFMTLNFIIKT